MNVKVLQRGEGEKSDKIGEAKKIETFGKNERAQLGGVPR